MKGQLLFRGTNQVSKSGKKVFVVIGLVTLEENELINDGFKYDLLDMAVHKSKDFRELNNASSPEDLLESAIWNIK